MNTISLPYILEDKNLILSLMKNQNNVVKFIYNRLHENKELKQKELTALVNSMNNVFIDSWLKQSAIYKAKSLIMDRIIFGGKNLFLKRLKNKITKEEYRLQKLLPLYIIGEGSKGGNRKFEFKVIEDNKINFFPKRDSKIELQLPKLRNNYKKILHKLQILTEQNEIPITISLDLKNIYITYDEKLLKEKPIDNKVKNRIIAIDLNPNYIGYSIKDWKDKDNSVIVKTGIISIKKLNDKEFNLKKERISSDNPKMLYIHNKRNYEIFEISKKLTNVAKHYKVESFAIEDLSMKHKDNKKGLIYNRLVNNMWNRNKLESNLEKRLGLANIKLYKMYPQYSSFIGNILNTEYPDCVNASLEINRRCFCFKNNIKPVIFPDFTESIKHIKQSLEELFANKQVFIDKIKSWIDLYKQVKNSKMRYRISLDDCKKSFKVLYLFNKKSLIEEIQFI